MITIYTSYWAYLTNIPKNKYYIVQVSNTQPKGIGPSEIDAVWPAAMPDYTTMVKAFHDKKIDAKQYSTMYDTILTQRKDQIKNEYKSLYNTAKKLNKELVFICWEKPGNFCHRTQLANFFVSQWPDTFTHKELLITQTGKYQPCRIHITYRQGTKPFRVNGQLIDKYIECANPEEYINQVYLSYRDKGYSTDPIRDCVIDGQKIFLSKTFWKGSFTITYRNANQNAPKFAYSFHIRNEEKRVFSCADIKKTMEDLHKEYTSEDLPPNYRYTGIYNILESKAIRNGKPVLRAIANYSNSNGWQISIKTTLTKKRNNPYQIIIFRKKDVDKTVYETELTLEKKIEQIRYYRHNKGYQGNITTDINERGEQIMSGNFSRTYEKDGFEGVEQVSYGSAPYLSFEDLQKRSRGETISPNKVSYTLNYKGQIPITRTRSVRSILQDDEYTPMNSGRSWNTKHYRINREVEGTQAILEQIDKLILQESKIKEEIQQLTEQQKTAKNDRSISAAKRKKLDEITDNRKKQDELYNQLIGPLPKRGQKPASEQLPVTTSLENADDFNTKLETLKTKYFVKDKRYKTGLRPKK